MSKDVPERRQDDLRRRLRQYAETWRDDEFLDSMCDWADAGRRFTPAQADAIEDSLTYWKRRLTGPSYDPDRPPPGTEPIIWELATLFRRLMEARGLWCPSRREIYTDLARIIDRDHLRDNHTPWLGQGDKPGWFRMLVSLITYYIEEEVNDEYPYSVVRDFAQSGCLLGLKARLIEQAKLTRFAEIAEPASTREPTAERRAQVKARIARRSERPST